MQTRAGHSVRLVAKGIGPARLLACVIEDRVEYWLPSGKYRGTQEQHPLDLMGEWMDEDQMAYELAMHELNETRLKLALDALAAAYRAGVAPHHMQALAYECGVSMDDIRCAADIAARK